MIAITLTDLLNFILTFQNYIEAALALLIAWLVGKRLSLLVRRRLHEKAPKHVIQNASKTVYYLVILIGVAIAIRALEIPGLTLTELLIAGGFIGIVIGLAAQQTLSNLFAGILLLIERSFKIGDFINYGNNVGMVVDIGFLSTKVQSWEGFSIRIPSSQLFNSVTINYSSSIVRLVKVNFTVPYETDINKVIEAMINKLNQEWYVLVEPPPRIFPIQFAENGITIEVRAWTSGKTWFELYSNLPRLVENTLKELGIPYSYPKRIISQANIWEKQ